ncbi:50S ribosomal protein L29 [Erysipelotrichaceae bacterium]|nr:50S ribosomal protein L29 [Erysipelotrichaceae bacterium]
MKANEVRELETADIKEQVKSKKEELFGLRFQQATGQLEDTSQIRKIRKDIARMLTELTARESAQ